MGRTPTGKKGKRTRLRDESAVCVDDAGDGGSLDSSGPTGLPMLPSESSVKRVTADWGM